MNTRPTSESNAEQTADAESTAEANQHLHSRSTTASPDLKAAEATYIAIVPGCVIGAARIQGSSREIGSAICLAGAAAARIHVSPTDDEICDAVVSITMIEQPQVNHHYILLDHTTHEPS